MRVLTQIRARANDQIDTIDAALDSHSRIVHVTSYVCKDLSLEAELADGLAVLAGLFARDWARQFDVVDTVCGQLWHDRYVEEARKGRRGSYPNSSNALAICILVSVSKKAFANCSPSRSVDSTIVVPCQPSHLTHAFIAEEQEGYGPIPIILNLEIFDKKSPTG